MMKVQSFFIAFAKKISFLAVITVLILGLGFLIGLPLWFLATKNPELYNIVFLSLAGACVLFLVIRKFLRPKDH